MGNFMGSFGYNINNLPSTCDDGGCSELVFEFKWWSRTTYFDSWKAEFSSFSLLAPLGMSKCQKWVWLHWTESHRMLFVCSNLHTIYLRSMHRKFLKILTEHGRCVVCKINELYTECHVELEDINSGVPHGVINLDRIWSPWVMHSVWVTYYDGLQDSWHNWSSSWFLQRPSCADDVQLKTACTLRTYFAMAATTLLLQASSSAVAALSAGGGKWRRDEKTNQTCFSTLKVSLRTSNLGQNQSSGGLWLKEFKWHGENWSVHVSWLKFIERSEFLKFQNQFTR